MAAKVAARLGLAPVRGARYPREELTSTCRLMEVRAQVPVQLVNILTMSFWSARYAILPVDPARPLVSVTHV